MCVWFILHNYLAYFASLSRVLDNQITKTKTEYVC